MVVLRSINQIPNLRFIGLLLLQSFTHWLTKSLSQHVKILSFLLTQMTPRSKVLQNFLEKVLSPKIIFIWT